jgi:hypothetical protein
LPTPGRTPVAAVEWSCQPEMALDPGKWRRPPIHGPGVLGPPATIPGFRYAKARQVGLEEPVDGHAVAQDNCADRRDGNGAGASPSLREPAIGAVQ